jgi:hypothetical protein
MKINGPLGSFIFGSGLRRRFLAFALLPNCFPPKIDYSSSSLPAISKPISDPAIATSGCDFTRKQLLLKHNLALSFN